jgi:hypothetical protein
MHPRLVGDLSLDEGSPDVRRADGVRGNALRATFEGDDLGQPFEAVLGGDVGTLVGRGPQPVDGGDVDNAPPAPVVHTREHGTCQPERRHEHQSDDPAEPLGRELLDR